MFEEESCSAPCLYETWWNRPRGRNLIAAFLPAPRTSPQLPSPSATRPPRCRQCPPMVHGRPGLRTRQWERADVRRPAGHRILGAVAQLFYSLGGVLVQLVEVDDLILVEV